MEKKKNTGMSKKSTDMKKTEMTEQELASTTGGTNERLKENVGLHISKFYGVPVTDKDYSTEVRDRASMDNQNNYIQITEDKAMK